jgi:tRNA 2-selenouridine synthase
MRWPVLTRSSTSVRRPNSPTTTFPGAISCPVLDDAQRAEVGTLYKQVSPFVAKKLGAAYISANIACHLQERFLERDKSWRPLIVCWRGGMRSGAMTTVFRSVGWDACQLEGGYKAFRNHVLGELERLPGLYRFHVIAGPTGSGKTRILQAMAGQGAQVLDLEGLACHRGSVLGRQLGHEQPGQKGFETCLLYSLAAFDSARPVFVESESRKIGRLRLPEALFLAMQHAPCSEIQVARDDRVAFLLQDYAHFLHDVGELAVRLNGLRALLGNERIDDWLALAVQGNFSRLTASLLELHYDPLYGRALGHLRGPRRQIAAGPLTPAEITRLARQVQASVS